MQLSVEGKSRLCWLCEMVGKTRASLILDQWEEKPKQFMTCVCACCALDASFLFDSYFRNIKIQRHSEAQRTKAKKNENYFNHLSRSFEFVSSAFVLWAPLSLIFRKYQIASNSDSSCPLRILRLWWLKWVITLALVYGDTQLGNALGTNIEKKYLMSSKRAFDKGLNDAGNLVREI